MTGDCHVRFCESLESNLWATRRFCMFYKALDSGKFPWPNTSDKTHLGITKAQLSMLLEALDWRNPKWSNPPERLG